MFGCSNLLRVQVVLCFFFVWLLLLVVLLCVEQVCVEHIKLDICTHFRPRFALAKIFLVFDGWQNKTKSF